MPTSPDSREDRRRALRSLLAEGRGLQRYIFGAGAPLFPLRRYARVLSGTPRLHSLPPWIWRASALFSLIEPMALLPQNEPARELVKRMNLAIAVTEATPWAFARSRSAGPNFGSLVALLIVSFLLEAALLPLRSCIHALMWAPYARRLDDR